MRKKQQGHEPKQILSFHHLQHDFFLAIFFFGIRRFGCFFFFLWYELWWIFIFNLKIVHSLLTHSHCTRTCHLPQAPCPHWANEGLHLPAASKALTPTVITTSSDLCSVCTMLNPKNKNASLSYMFKI